MSVKSSVFLLCVFSLLACPSFADDSEGDMSESVSEVSLGFGFEIVPIDQITRCTKYKFELDGETSFLLNINAHHNIQTLLVTNQEITNCSEAESFNCTDTAEGTNMISGFCAKISFSGEDNIEVSATPNSYLTELNIYPTLVDENSEGSIQLYFTEAGTPLSNI